MANYMFKVGHTREAVERLSREGFEIVNAGSLLQVPGASPMFEWVQYVRREAPPKVVDRAEEEEHTVRLDTGFWARRILWFLHKRGIALPMNAVERWAGAQARFYGRAEHSAAVTGAPNILVMRAVAAEVPCDAWEDVEALVTNDSEEPSWLEGTWS